MRKKDVHIMVGLLIFIPLLLLVIRKQAVEECIGENLTFLIAESYVLQKEDHFLNDVDSLESMNSFREHAIVVTEGKCPRLLESYYRADPYLRKAYIHAKYFLLNGWFYLNKEESKPPEPKPAEAIYQTLI